MKFKDFIARVNPQSRPKKIQYIWQPGVKYHVKGFPNTYTLREVLPYGTYIGFTNRSTAKFDRMVVISTTGFPAYQDRCELI